MANNELIELEKKLHDEIDKQKENSNRLLLAVNSRNRERVEEQKKDSAATDLRHRIIVVGVFAIGAMVAFFFYKATFGMF